MSNLQKAFALSVCLHAPALLFFLAPPIQKQKPQTPLYSVTIAQAPRSQRVEKNIPSPNPLEREQTKITQTPKPINTTQEASKIEPSEARYEARELLAPEASQTKRHNREEAQSEKPIISAEKKEVKIDESKEYLAVNAHKIRELVSKYKKYPSKAVKMGIDGVCIVSFRVLENGGAEDIKIVKSSGYASLDKSSLEAVEEAAKELPKAPKGGATIVVPIEYKLY